MKFLIPAKSDSIRCPNKNWRDFHGCQSLVDIAIFKTLALARETEGAVYVSCDDEQYRDHVEQCGAHFQLREPHLCDNDMPFGEVIQAMVSDLPGDDDVFILHCTSPLFDDVGDMVSTWHCQQHEYDSMTAVYPEQVFRYDEHHNPLGWSNGSWFLPSQYLPMTYRTTFCASITKRETLAKHPWYYGANPYWFEATGQAFDVDTEEDFAMAQRVYAARMERT